jgi:hypothetical protein
MWLIKLSGEKAGHDRPAFLFSFIINSAFTTNEHKMTSSTQIMMVIVALSPRCSAGIEWS